MTRQTSIDSFNKIKNDGLLSQRRWQVYETLFIHGPLTGGECFVKCRKEFPGQFETMLNSNVITRLGELRDLGVVKELGERRCTVSGQNVILWDVTGNLPHKIDKKERDVRYLCFVCNGHYKGETSSHPSRDFPLIRCTGELKKYKGEA